MALPKKDTRVITLANGQEFLCHFSEKWWWKSAKYRLVVQQKDAEGQLLLVDLADHRFMPSRKTKQNAIRAAYRYGWNPAVKGKPFRLKSTGIEFIPEVEEASEE